MPGHPAAVHLASENHRLPIDLGTLGTTTQPHPFTYDASADWIGASSALMWTGSPIAYALATVATNYWVWKLNQL